MKKSNIVVGIGMMACSAFTLADAVSISSDGKSATIACPAMSYFVNPKITVTVNQDASSGDYLYHYSVRPGADDKQTISTIRIADLEEGTLVTKGDGWKLCNYYQRQTQIEPAVVCLNKSSHRLAAGQAYEGLTIRSKFAPGVVRYEVVGADNQPLFTDSFVQTLLPYYHGDAEALSEDVQEQIGEQCPSGMVKKKNDRQMTGITIGPSRAISPAISRADATEESAKAIHLIIQDKKEVPLANVNTGSIHVKDTAGNPIDVSTGSMTAQTNTTGPGWLFAVNHSESELPCNVKGLVVEGTMNDGTAFKSGVPLNAASCAQEQESQFHLTFRTSKHK